MDLVKRHSKKILFLLTDLIIVFGSYVFALYIRLDFSFEKYNQLDLFFRNMTIVLVIYLIVYTAFRLHAVAWKSIGIDDALLIIVANIASLVCVLVLRRTSILFSFPGSVVVIAFFINTVLMEIIRFSYRIFSSVRYRYKHGIVNASCTRVAIYGAGKAGQLLTREIMQNNDYNYKIVGFIDDNLNLSSKRIIGYPVLGTGCELESIIKTQEINEIIIAMPSTPVAVRSEIARNVMNSDVETTTMMSNSIIDEPDKIRKSLKKVEIKDLLNRVEITFNNKEISEIISGNSVLVTGAGGSIGSEIVRQIFKYNPERIVLFDINETGLYQIEQELLMKVRVGELTNNVEIIPLIGSIRDKRRLNNVFKKYKFNIVFHAAAHKHVPLMEQSPKEAVKNNIFGTRNLIEISKRYKVNEFVNISTDKAVNPTNVMGATKRFNEMMLQCESNMCGPTKFVAVRFGNVLGSNGSVIPLFQKQIENGGPVTVTHPDIVRYFMTIPEAVNLVLQATSYAEGGEIFVLDMGKPVQIRELAENMIRLSGYTPNVDIDIKYVGLRPGEKLYEELLMAEEGLKKTENALIFVAKPNAFTKDAIDTSLEELSNALQEADNRVVIDALKRVVPTFVNESKESGNV